MADESLVRFRRVVAAALAELENRRQEVNDLNVFPVADGDTGDNMALTMRAVLDELNRMNGQPLDVRGRDEIVAAVARAALLGARGNSGVILSQIVRGAAEELAGRPGELVDPVLVSAALARAADAAYASVRNPAEGTLMTRDTVPGARGVADVRRRQGGIALVVITALLIAGAAVSWYVHGGGGERVGSSAAARRPRSTTPTSGRCWPTAWSAG